MKFKRLTLLLMLLILLPQSVFAGDYLVGIPNIDNSNLTLGAYINAIYAMSISVAALLAVIKIIIAGVKWMLTDIVTSKQEAKTDIQNSLLGLLIIMSAVLILTTINPALTNTNVLQSLTPAEPFSTSSARATSVQAQQINQVLGPLAQRVRPYGGGSIIETTMVFESPPEPTAADRAEADATGSVLPAYNSRLSAEQDARLRAEVEDIQLRMTQACAIVGGRTQVISVGSGTNTRRGVTCSKELP